MQRYARKTCRTSWTHSPGFHSATITDTASRGTFSLVLKSPFLISRQTFLSFPDFLVKVFSSKIQSQMTKKGFLFVFLFFVGSCSTAEINSTTVHIDSSMCPQGVHWSTTAITWNAQKFSLACFQFCWPHFSGCPQKFSMATAVCKRLQEFAEEGLKSSWNQIHRTPRELMKGLDP